MQSTHEYVLKRLAETKGDWPRVAVHSGVPYRTLKKIGSRATPFPRIDTVEKLARYFRDGVAA